MLDLLRTLSTGGISPTVDLGSTLFWEASVTTLMKGLEVESWEDTLSGKDGCVGSMAEAAILVASLALELRAIDLFTMISRISTYPRNSTPHAMIDNVYQPKS